MNIVQVSSCINWYRFFFSNLGFSSLRVWEKTHSTHKKNEASHCSTTAFAHTYTQLALTPSYSCNYIVEISHIKAQNEEAILLTSFPAVPAKFLHTQHAALKIFATYLLTVKSNNVWIYRSHHLLTFHKRKGRHKV